MARPPRLLLGHWWVCLDTETTGLPDDPLSEVVEVALGLVNPDGVVVATYSTLLEHDARAEAAAYCQEHLHGIRPRDTRHGPGREVAEATLNRVRACWSRTMLANRPHQLRLQFYAWNREFDQAMVERAGLLRPPAGGRDGDGPGRWGECLQLRTTPHLYAAGMPRPEKPDSRRHERASLQDAAEWLQLEATGPAHRALADVYTTAAVVTAIARGDHPGSKTWRGRS